MHISAYAILCIFSATIALVRYFLTGDTYYNGLVWNLILAFLPYMFALGYTTYHGKGRFLFILLWFFFLPNSFYIVTDFVHLSRFPEMVYYDSLMILSMAFSAMVAGYASMELMHHHWNIHYHKTKAWIIMVMVIVFSMIGVYMGRFLRFTIHGIYFMILCRLFVRRGHFY